VTNPLFWLVLSLLFVTVSLTIVLVVAIPTLRELSRDARSAEKLFDTLRREFPPTLQASRLTGLEISDLTDDVSEGVQSAGQVVKQVDQSLTGVLQQAQRAQSSTRSVVVGIKAAWRTFTRSPKPASQRRSVDRSFTSQPEAEFVAVSENGRSSAAPDTRAKAQHLTADEELNQPPLVRKPDPVCRDPNHPTSEKRLKTPTASKGEQARSISNQPDTNTASSDPRPHQLESKRLNTNLEDDGEGL